MINQEAPLTSAPHPVCEVVRLRAARKTLWLRQVWAGLPELPHPLAIGHEEVDLILSDPRAAAGDERAFYTQDPKAIQLGGEIEDAERRLSEEPRWRRLVDSLGLPPEQQHLLALAAAAALEPSLGRVLAYLHDQPELVLPSSWLASVLFGEEGTAVLPAEAPLVSWGLVRRAPEGVAVPDAMRGWSADPSVVAWLAGEGTEDLPRGLTLYEPDAFEQLPVLYEGVMRGAEEFIALREAEAEATVEVELVGPPGSGRRTLAGQLAARRGRPLLAVSGELFLEGVPEGEAHARVQEAVRAALLHDALLYWDEPQNGGNAARKALRDSSRLHLVGRGASLPESPAQEVLLRSLELPPLTRGAREQLWRALSDDEVPWQVSDWVLTPGEIARLVHVAAAGDAAVQQVCRRPAESLNLLVRLPLPFEPHDLILPRTIQDQLDDFERQVRLRWDVYEDWGFERLVPNGRGIVALFAGPSGTGKTMSAQVLAKRLGLELYRLDPAQVVNKYIGETEKRLKTIFDECDRAHFLLLIDECEGMFGQRFSSKDAHDRYANLEIDYLLQRLERFQGVAVLATNRKGDLDPSFMRRIRFVIDYLPPGPAERAVLWKSAIPERTPSGMPLRGEIDWQALAEKVSFNGAEIKLAAINAAFLAFGEKKQIEMSHLLTAIRRELAKKGQTLRGFE